MIDEIGLYFNDIWPEKKNGPGKVAKNLIAGLNSLGVKIHKNISLKYTGVLQPYIPLTELKESDLIGPNVFVLPNHWFPGVWEKKRNIVASSEWIKDQYKTQLDSKHNIYVWPVGIDTDLFVPSSETKKIDCLIYYKHTGRPAPSKDTYLKSLLRKIIDSNMTYKEIIYGKYNEEELIEVAQSARFCVTVTSTETQGIAYQEILSMGVPIYVFDTKFWTHQFDLSGKDFLATSAPYFDDRCGIKHSDLSRFDEFLDRINEFSPREYILENLTLKKCASEYLSLLEKCHAE